MRRRRQNGQEHWERVFTSAAPTDVSWYQPEPTVSLQLIEACGLGAEDPVIDIGGGASTLVDTLLDRDYHHITVLDFAASALEAARHRLGERAREVEWIQHDITNFSPSRQWTLWHDRAVFHFLTDAGDRAAYRRVLHSALAPGGHVVIATFGPGGPHHCSGLKVVRYASDELARELGNDLELRESHLEQHATPTGHYQEFLYVRLQRVQ
jgi:trans-aconitate methyltransferase